MRRGIAFAVVTAAGLCAGQSRAAVNVNVGNHNLTGGSTNQVVIVQVSGGDPINGFNLRAQIGDGSGAGVEPKFADVQFTPGTIWDGKNATVIGGGPEVGFESLAAKSIVLNTSGDSVNAGNPGAQNLLRLVIDTTGFSSGTYALKLSNTDYGVNSSYQNTSGEQFLSIPDGSITIVPEPATAGILASGALLLTGLRRRRARQ
jgi:hypothetical protein